MNNRTTHPHPKRTTPRIHSGHTPTQPGGNGPLPGYPLSIPLWGECRFAVDSRGALWMAGLTTVARGVPT